ncbi:MAG: MFS transporter [Serratia proteamaculans]|jgi:predicted MFS family arabinose efflux permease|uniref:MFS transporter n=1 Tax=Serratia proteamaculans TaxID=28151 RepID=UPI000D9DA9E7|nr:MFS transporter [Serratia proteamaculans]SPZ57150.1 Purine efflux pump PbuE [Serratia quinivorans]NWA74043.1 MFS transporter [Serratia proteamaculans]CAI0982182.1 Purine efflux pump PbuE [Serratia proteamaculans]CAI1102904.1 Purine efflux pump PbuE [Serratia proteamaculans]CAI1161221.1 Purine efflux pump PbuE [Serratia proteamaculans]
MKLTDYNGHFLTLCLMATGTFAIGTDAFIVAGILDEISGTFAVSPAQAGQLISIFALAYMLFAPLTAWLLGNLNRKHILQLALVLFIAGNLVCAYADSFLQMSAGRVLAALGAACYTPQAAAAAVGLVAEKRRGLAISIVYGGMTLAIALGIPFGTFLARLIGWREIFLLIALLGAVSLLGLSLALSAIAAPGKHTLKERLAPLRQKAVLTTLLITFFAVCSEHIVYSYVSVLLKNTQFGPEAILPIALLVFGIGAVIGNFVSGLLTDTFGSKFVLLFSVSIQTVSLFLLTFYVSSPWWVLAIFLVWGITGWMYLVPIQHHLLSLSKRFGALTVSLNSSVLYAGIAAGGMLGGLTLYSLPAFYLPLFSLPLGAIALLLTLFFFQGEKANE